MFQINDVIDDTYMIVQEIGHGGTGVVFLAYHLRLEKYVVLKKIKDNFVGAVNVRGEVDILKRLHHRYLPQVYDFVQRGREVYTVIDYIQGYDLEYYMQNGYQFSEEDIVKWLKQLCDVLDYLHNQNPAILHSDIKPGNIMVNSEGNICLIDFNISLDNNQEKGINGLSQYYAAPEQYKKAEAICNGMDNSGIQLDARMDIYSLGATFYFLMSGIRPTCNYSEIYPIEYMDLPYRYGLLQIIAKAMKFNRDERYQSVVEMNKALTNLNKTDVSYKIKQIVKYGSFILYAMFLSVGILCCTVGNKKIKEQNYLIEYADFMDAYNAGNNSVAISKGVKILNNSKYKDILNDNLEYSCELYHAIGDCYFYSGDYSNSSNYYGAAYEKSVDNTVDTYFRDYAISLVKADKNNIDLAQNIIEAQENNGLSIGAKIVEAQIYYQKEEYESALNLADEVLNDDMATTEDKFMTYILKSDISSGQNDLNTEIQMREAAKNLDQSNRQNKRQLALLYIEYAKKYSGLGGGSYYSKAQVIYEELVNTTYPVLEDQINLSVIYQMQGTSSLLNKAKDILTELEAKNDDYRIYMNLAFVYSKLNDKVKAAAYCRQALNRYSEDKDTSGQDLEQMNALKRELGL